LRKASAFIKQYGGATSSSLWGKFWLAVLGVVHWDVVNPIPPEMWLLPEWLPIHPWRMYAEMRMAGQSLAFLASKRWTYQGDMYFIADLRKEVLVEPYENIVWASRRSDVSSVDCFEPRSWGLEAVSWAYLNIYKPYFQTTTLKQRGEDRLSELIDMQNRNSCYLGIAATDKPMNTIIAYFRDGPESYSFQRHAERLKEFLWMTSDGMQMNSTNGSQCWDTAFLVQAACTAGFQMDERWRPMLLKAYEFLERHQVREDCVDQDKCYRQRRKGGWTFSTREQGFVVSDCAAEALRAVIMLEKSGFPKIFDDVRLFDAVDTLLLYQSKAGGVAAFEATRGGDMLNYLNPTEIFTRFMTELDYPECTSSCVAALSLFRKHWPVYRAKEVDSFIMKGVEWIKTDQRQDGSWYGNWGVCFTYGTMFSLEALACLGEFYDNSQPAKRGCDFLLSKQREDGGWSEAFKSCETMEYHEDPAGSLVCQTAWALIGLAEARYPDPEPLRRGVAFLMSKQQDNGEWLKEAIPGSFHGFCTFSYPNYKFNFTIKALGLVAKRYPGL
jgi:lanosterol synthase